MHEFQQKKVSLFNIYITVNGILIVIIAAILTQNK